jgi:L-threonylcarbamoyladenylate synthase
VVFPTETAYGLAADATSERAVRRVFAIKGRESRKSLPLIVANLKMAEKYAILSPVLRKLVKNQWPGPLTVVAPARTKNKLSKGVVRGGTVAVRVSSHPIARELSQRLGRPIVSTSANLSGQPTCYSIRAVKKQLGNKPDFYFDVGYLPKRKPSRIIVGRHMEIVVLRK